MKKTSAIIMLLILSVLVSGISWAGGVSQEFSWNVYSDEFDRDPAIVGTKIYVGTSPGVYEWSVDAKLGTTSGTVDDLYCEKEYFVAASHYSTEATGKGMLESELSPEISFTTIDCIVITFNPPPPLPEAKKLGIPIFKKK